MRTKTMFLLLAFIGAVYSQEMECNFSDGDTCNFGFTQNSNEMVWTPQDSAVLNAEVPAGEVRPDADYFYVTAGEMMKRQGGYTATFSTPAFQGFAIDGSAHCFSFWVRAAGWPIADDPAQFTVYLETADLSIPEEERRLYLLMQNITDANGNVWRYYEVDFVFTQATSKVFVDVLAGQSYFSYFAVDAVKLTDGYCDQRAKQFTYTRQLANCPGNFLLMNGDPVGAYRCTEPECVAMCNADNSCKGYSFIDTIDDGLVDNFQCYLKTAACVADVANPNQPYTFNTKNEATGQVTNAPPVGNLPAEVWTPLLDSRSNQQNDCYLSYYTDPIRGDSFCPECNTLDKCKVKCESLKNTVTREATGCRGVTFTPKTLQPNEDFLYAEGHPCVLKVACQTGYSYTNTNYAYYALSLA